MNNSHNSRDTTTDYTYGVSFNYSYMLNVKGSNCGDFMGGMKNVAFKDILGGNFQLPTYPTFRDKTKLIYKFLQTQGKNKDGSYYKQFCSLCEEIGTLVKQPSNEMKNILFDGSSPDFVGLYLDDSLMPWSIAYTIDWESLTGESRLYGEHVIEYGKSLLRRSPQVLRTAVVVCSIHSNGGVFYRLSRDHEILRSKLFGMADVAAALFQLLMASPQDLGLNIEAINSESWSIFQHITPKWHGGSSLIFCEQSTIFEKYIPEYCSDNKKCVAKVSKISCVEECAHLTTLYAAEGYYFLSLNDGNVMLTNLIGTSPTREVWGNKLFLYTCWEQISHLHALKLVHRDVRLPNFIIDTATGNGKVIDFQSVVAADTSCVYNGSVETASAYVWSVLKQKQNRALPVVVAMLPIDDAVSFMLCTIIARFDLQHALTAAIHSGTNLTVKWSSIFSALLLHRTYMTARDIAVVSIASLCQEMCMGEVRLLDHEEHMKRTHLIMQSFIDMAGS